jgi:hypothetical protein
VRFYNSSLGWIESARRSAFLGDSAPSFHRLLLARRRAYRNALELTESGSGPVWAWETKTGGKALAATAGVASPRTLVAPGPLSVLDFSGLPQGFVIKPDWGTNARGVFVLTRNMHQAFEHLSGVNLKWADVSEHVATIARDQGIKSDRFLVEEMLCQPGESPIDWKFYCFYGIVGLIMQIRRGTEGKEYMFYDSQWSPLRRIRPSVPITANLPAPFDPEGLLTAASDLSQCLATPFVRVDLYEFDKKVYFGEFTISPGGTQLFSGAVDRSLGEHWDRAAARLAVSNNPIVVG